MTQLNSTQLRSESFRQTFEHINVQENSGPIAIGSGIDQRVFKYEIKHEGGVLNILPTSKAPHVTAKKTPVYNYPPFQEENFIGREKEIQQLAKAIESQKIIELYGLQGSGKSALVKYFIHSQISHISKKFSDGAIYFLCSRCQSLEDLLQWLFEEFYESDCPFKPSIPKVKQSLCDKQALIVIDGSELSSRDIEILHDTAPNCTFLLTSWRRSLWSEGESISLGELSVEDSLRLIVRKLELKTKQPLQSQDYATAESLCGLLKKYPLEILQQITGVCEGTESLLDTVRRIQSNVSSEQIFYSLSPEKQSILKVLAALDGETLTSEQISAISILSSLDFLLKELCESNILQAEEFSFSSAEKDVRYRLSGNLLAHIQEHECLLIYRERAINYFKDWIEQCPDSKNLRRESNKITYLLNWAAETGKWMYVLSLGKSFEQRLVCSGDLGVQSKVLRLYLQAAKELDDKPAVGYAFHQIGTLEICVGNVKKASSFLAQSIHLREALSNTDAARFTQHNLDLLAKPRFSLTNLLTQASLSAYMLAATLIGGLSFLGFQFYEVLEDLQEARIRVEALDLEGNSIAQNEEIDILQAELNNALDEIRSSREEIEQKSIELSDAYKELDVANQTIEELEGAILQGSTSPNSTELTSNVILEASLMSERDCNRKMNNRASRLRNATEVRESVSHEDGVTLYMGNGMTWSMVCSSLSNGSSVRGYALATAVAIPNSDTPEMEGELNLLVRALLVD